MPRVAGRDTYVGPTKILWVRVGDEAAAASRGGTGRGSAEPERPPEVEAHVIVVPEVRVPAIEPPVDRERQPQRDHEPGYQPGVVPRRLERQAQPLRRSEE